MAVELHVMGREEDQDRPGLTEHLLVEASYWYQKKERTEQALVALHRALFTSPIPALVPAIAAVPADAPAVVAVPPIVAGPEGAAPAPELVLVPPAGGEIAPVALDDASAEAARDVWRRIKKNPASPDGPLSLEAVSQAVLVGADFNDPSDRHVFFEFIAKHPGRFQAIFITVFKLICDEALDVDLELGRLADAAKNSPMDVESPNNVVDNADHELPASPRPDRSEEFAQLQRIWIPGLYDKIKQAMGRDDFIRDLFLGDPDFAHSLSRDEHAEYFLPELSLQYPAAVTAELHKQAREYSGVVKTILQRLALQYPGVVGAALHNNDLGHLHAVLTRHDRDGMAQLLLQPITDYTEPANAEGEFNTYRITDLIPEDEHDFAPLLVEQNEWALESQSFIDQVKSLGKSKPHVMISVAKLMTEGMSYYARHAEDQLKKLIRKLSSADFVNENQIEINQFNADNAELRARLYHPVCIGEMQDFWSTHFECFRVAAGDDNQFLTHLISSMRDPIAFVSGMLDSKIKTCDFYPETEDDVRNRIAYFRDRLDIVMSALGKIPGKQAQKTRNKLLGLRIPVTDVAGAALKSVRELLRAEVSKLIRSYANTTVDPGERLLAVLDDNFTRGKCKLTQAQVAQLLHQNGGDLPRHNARFELIIARDDYLWSLGKAAIPAMHPHMRALRFPYLTARIELEEHAKIGLMSYVEAESADNQKWRTVKIAKDFLIATKEALWREVDPYSRHPLQALIHRWMPGAFKLDEFFAEKKNQLATFSPIFRLRLEWDALSAREKAEKNIASFEAYLQREQAAIWSAPAVMGQIDPQEMVVTPNEKEGFARVMADAARGDGVFGAFKISHEEDARSAEGFALDFGGAPAPAVEAASDLNSKNKERAYTPYELSLLENPTRLDAFLASVNTPSKVKVARDFILSIDIQSPFQRPGTVMALTAEQVLRFILVKELPTEEEKQQGHTCQQLAIDLVLKRPELLREILLSQEPRVKSKIPQAITVLESIITALDYRSLDSEILFAFLSLQPKDRGDARFALLRRDINLLRVLMDVKGTLSHAAEDTLADYIAKIIENSGGDESLPLRIAEKLTLDDLMQMQKVSQGTFDEFIIGNNADAARCRQLLAPILLSLSPEKIKGFNEVFKAEPGYLLGCLSRLDEQQLRNLTEVNEDIFELQSHEGRNHPLADFLASEDQPCDPAFMLRCMRSDYEPLALLMSEVLVNKQPLERRYELLTTILTDPGCDQGVLDLITRGASNPIVAALKSPDFVGRYLKNDKSGFEENARALWSTICRSETVVGYLESSQCIHDANANTDTESEFYLPAIYTEYQLSVYEECVPETRVKQSTSRYRFDYSLVAPAQVGLEPSEAQLDFAK